MKARKSSTSDQSDGTPTSISQSGQDVDLLYLPDHESHVHHAVETNVGFSNFQQDFRFSMNGGEWPDTTNAAIDVNSMLSHVDDKFPDITEIQELYVHAINKHIMPNQLGSSAHRSTSTTFTPTSHSCNDRSTIRTYCTPSSSSHHYACAISCGHMLLREVQSTRVELLVSIEVLVCIWTMMRCR